MAEDKRHSAEDVVVLPRAEFEELLEMAAARGAKTALASVGLDDSDAGEDVREMRNIAQMIQSMKDQALKTIANAVVMFILGAIVLAAGSKLKAFGG